MWAAMSGDEFWQFMKAVVVIACWMAIVTYFFILVTDWIFDRLRSYLWDQMTDEQKEEYWRLGGDYMRDKR